jgi:hypothetical protein
MKGKKVNIELFLFIASVVLCVSCGIFFFNKGVENEEKPSEHLSSVVKQLADQQSIFNTEVNTSIGELMKRVSTLEESPKEGVLRFDKPVYVILKSAVEAKPSPKPGPLLKRAGIK